MLVARSKSEGIQNLEGRTRKAVWTTDSLTSGTGKRKQVRMMQAGSVRLPSEQMEQSRRQGGWPAIYRVNLLALFRPPSGEPKLWPAVTAAIFVSLVLLTLPTVAPDLGIDPSWCAVLNWAHERGAQFGKDIVFTYGPLGYLTAPYCLAQPAGTVVLVNALLCFQVAVGLCLAAWRLGPIWRWSLLALFVLESANIETRVDMVFEIGVFCWGFLCLVESGRRQRICAASLVLLAGFAALTKMSHLFMASFTICAVAIHVGVGADRRLGVRMLLGFAGIIGIGWLACGQALSNLGTFVLNGFLISREYDQAASLEGLPMLRWEGFLLGIVALATILLSTGAGLHSLNRRQRLRGIIALAWVAGLLFLVWKHSMVRLDRYHIVELLVFIPVVTLSLEALRDLPTKLHYTGRAMALVCCVVSVGTLESAFLPSLSDSFRQPFRQFAYHLGWLFSSARNRQRLEPDLAALRSEAQLPALRRLIGTNTVDVFGSLQAYAMLNGLNYRPRPVFQSYAAYTPVLAQLNEGFFLGDDAPEFVLFQLSAPYHQFRALDDGPALRGLLVNYGSVGTEGPFVLLKHRSSAMARLTLIQEGTTSAGKVIDLSQFPDANLWLDLEVEPTIAGRVVSFLYRPPAMRLAVWGQSAGIAKRLARRRAAPSVLRTGFVVSPFPLNEDDARELFGSRSALRPSGLSVEPDPGSEKFWKEMIRFHLYRIENPLSEPTLQ